MSQTANDSAVHRSDPQTTTEKQEGPSAKGSSELKKALNKKGSAATTEKRKVIYKGNLQIEVPNLKRARTALEKKAEKKDGYLVEASQSRNGKKVTGTWVFRIPQDAFHSFLKDVEQTATKTHSQHISGNDVTKEYVDLQSRLKAKKTMEKRLLQLMEEAKSTEDLLQVSKELSRVQEEMEQLKGRIKYLEDQTAFSTVTVHATQISPLGQHEGEPELMDQIHTAFLQSIGWLQDVFRGALVVGATLIPPVTILALITFPVVWWIRRRKKNI